MAEAHQRQRIHRRRDAAAAVADRPRAGERADRLKQIARYRGANDTSPTAESLGLSEGDVMSGEPIGGLQAARMPNVLAEDTWDLFRILLR